MAATTSSLRRVGSKRRPIRVPALGNAHPIGVSGRLASSTRCDVNGDGRPDIVASMAHDYGIFWLEQQPAAKWAKHVIDDSWSQAHAIVRWSISRQWPEIGACSPESATWPTMDTIPERARAAGQSTGMSRRLDPGGQADRLGQARHRLRRPHRWRHCRFGVADWMATAISISLSAARAVYSCSRTRRPQSSSHHASKSRSSSRFRIGAGRTADPSTALRSGRDDKGRVRLTLNLRESDGTEGLSIRPADFR